MNYYNFKKCHDFKITKREILFSIIILFVMIGIGFIVSAKISNYIAENNELYYQATKINNNAEEFQYAMETNLGNCLIYGEFKATEDIKIPELTGSYFAIKKNTEKYTRHIRAVTHRRGKTSYTTTETYYTWDNYDTEYKTSSSFEFLEKQFYTSDINLPYYQSISLNESTVSNKYQSWISCGYLYNNGDKWASVGDFRYSYSIIPTKFNGTILAKLQNNAMFNVNDLTKKIDVENFTIDGLIQYKQDTEDTPIIIFWIVWGIVIGISIFIFYYFDNKWLEDKKSE
jgi:predicted transcriptional regulator